MNRLKKTLRRSSGALALERKAQELLPERAYLSALTKVLPVLNRKRRGADVTLSREGRWLRARSQEAEIFFYARARSRRYIYPDGVRHACNKVRDRYLSGEELQPGVIIDVGANIGEFTLACLDEASLIVAVEPDPIAYGCLLKNTADIDKARTVSAALSDKSGEVEFFLASNSADSSVVEPMEHGGTISVAAMTLDELIQREAADMPISLLKVEAEGHEPEVLSGLQTRASQVRCVVVDGSPERKGAPTSEQCSRLLKERGFRVSRRGHMLRGVREVGPQFGMADATPDS